MPLQQSLLARRGSLWAISVVRHSPLRRILRLRACCAVGAVLSLPVPLSVRAVSLDPTVTLLKKETILPSADCWRGRGNTRLSDTERTYSQNVSLAPLLTLRHCPGDNSSSPFFHDSLIGSLRFCRSRGTTNRIFSSLHILSSNYSILQSKRVKDERILRIIV